MHKVQEDFLMKRITLSIAVCWSLIASISFAQNNTKADKNIFNHMDLGVTVGSTGLGIDLSMPAGDYVSLRTGFTYMPHFKKDMHFNVSVGYNDPSLSAEEKQRRFNRLAELMEGFTGHAIKSSVCMEGQPQMTTFKLLADVYPFKDNKHWHITAGFYAGPSRIAKAVNAQADMPSLMGVSMYNHIYWKAYYEQNIFELNGTGMEFPPEINQRFLAYGEMGMPVGRFKHDFYATQDMYYDHDVYDMEQYDAEGQYLLIHQKGDIQYHKGDLVYRQGDIYRMLPDDDFMIKAKAFVNAFRPYLGLGYNTTFGKAGRMKLAVDCGVMMWGGSPKIITHDGVDIAHDLTNVNGQVDNILRVIRHFPVFPVLEIRFARDIF